MEKYYQWLLEEEKIEDEKKLIARSAAINRIHWIIAKDRINQKMVSEELIASELGISKSLLRKFIKNYCQDLDFSDEKMRYYYHLDYIWTIVASTLRNIQEFFILSKSQFLKENLGSTISQEKLYDFFVQEETSEQKEKRDGKLYIKGRSSYASITSAHIDILQALASASPSELKFDDEFIDAHIHELADLLKANHIGISHASGILYFKILESGRDEIIKFSGYELLWENMTPYQKSLLSSFKETTPKTPLSALRGLDWLRKDYHLLYEEASNQLNQLFYAEYITPSDYNEMVYVMPEGDAENEIEYQEEEEEEEEEEHFNHPHFTITISYYITERGKKLLEDNDKEN
jgi:hypothetical protein